ncbi:MAG: lytic murein transglycosylase [Chiayiivirga sp.]|jgi:glucose-6-phosphate 1-epimerase|uniref:lytic murein transglycosylase n=1 Tax=Chiayiivirga sp. TaxID=2041042 RepID=UPI0025BCA396|nr:lytic murein transglycosylase [Chiayiivirga sp.]MCI1711298.1 lytic murein transglycosylase [Chiayiivirga sp.]MCI1727900.1 lytic murein transglycosylase [Chiayiivirga sp.]
MQAREIALMLVLGLASLGDGAAAQATAARDAALTRGWSDCLTRLRGEATRQGVNAASWERFTAGLAPDPTVLDALDAQPEFVTPIWDYLAALVDEERIADGRQRLREHADTLAQLHARYGVEPETVVAVWGVESDFGRVFGKRPLLTSLATLSCAGRRQGYFRGEFIATLKILQAGDARPEDLRGSWAGAFGHTQFMPSTFLRLAVDFDGDGRRDLIHNDADALASTANYLATAGWRRDQRWGFEVKVAAKFDPKFAGRRSKRPLSDWAQRGVTRVDGNALIDATTPGARSAAVILPTGIGGPAFVVFRNYDAIFSYNAAESYALAIALLSDRLRGGSGLVARWPTDDPGLSRVERRELQTLLVARGHDIGEIDGLIGAATRAAIQREQQRLEMKADGRAGQVLLRALRNSN